MRNLRSVAIATALAVWLVAGAAGAEGFVDVYLGGAFTEDDPIDVRPDPFGLSPAQGSVSFDDAAIGGVRGGYWIREAPFVGVALDISGFAIERDFGPNDGAIAVVPISALLMLRLPLGATDELPGGRVQPYGAVGPGAFISALGIDINGIDDFGDATADVGLDARGGVKFQILRWLALYAEYRYTRFDPKWEDTLEGVDTDIETDFQTHYVNFGIGFHF